MKLMLFPRPSPVTGPLFPHEVQNHCLESLKSAVAVRLWLLRRPGDEAGSFCPLNLQQAWGPPLLLVPEGLCSLSVFPYLPACGSGSAGEEQGSVKFGKTDSGAQWPGSSPSGVNSMLHDFTQVI